MDYRWRRNDCHDPPLVVAKVLKQNATQHNLEEILSCGARPLNVVGGTVTGWIRSKTPKAENSMSQEDLTALLSE
jgi:hypothetical protein